MGRLPKPGGDNNTWGDVLNAYLRVEHEEDGTLRLRTDGTLDGKESSAHKSTDPSLGASDVLYPSQKAVKTYVDSQVMAGVPDATTASKGKLQLTGDLSGSADTPKVKSRTSTVTVGPAGSAADYVCDGVADNVQIQAAIDALNSAGGGTMSLRKGTYDIAATIFLKSNVSIVGEGWNTILRSTNNLNTFPVRCFSVPTTNFMLKDLKFDLNGPNQTSLNTYISMTAPQNFTLDHVYIYNAYGFGILTQASGDPLTGVVPREGLVTNCRFDTQTATVPGTLRDFAVFNVQLSRIVNNYWGPCSTVASPNYALSAGRTMRDTIIANNTFDNTSMTAIGLEDIQGCIVANNRIQGSAGGHGIFINNFNAGVLIERNIICGNMISGSKYDGIKVGEVSGAKDMIIYGNTCYLNGRDGISIYGAISCSVFGNKAKNNNQAGNASPVGSGIRFSGGSPLDSHVFNNQCIDDQAVPTQTWGIYAGNGDGFVVQGNTASGNTVGAINIPGAASKQAHNQTGAFPEAHDGFRIVEQQGRRAVEVYSNQTTSTEGDLVKFNAENAAFDKKVLYIRNDGTDTAVEIDQGGTPVNSFDTALYLNVSHGSTNAGALRTVDASPATSVLLDKNNSGLTADIDQDVTNANWSSGSFRLVATSAVTDGGTYTKSGAIAAISSDAAATLGTITDTAEVLKISQLNGTATGIVLDIDNRGAGKSLVLKSNTTEKFSVASDGTVTASNKITNVTDPTNAQDAATKAYVDAQVGGGTPDATASIKGKLQLAGDLGGTAAAPTVTGITDANGLRILASIAVAAATNHFTMTNAVAGSPVFSVAGTDTNIGFLIRSKGSGVIALRPGSNSASSVQLQNAAGTSILTVDATNTRVAVGGSTPTSVLDVRGAIATAVSSKTASYSITATDSTILCDTTSAGFTVTLPSAAGIPGRTYTVKKTSADSNTLTIATNGGQTIDGAATLATAATNRPAFSLQSDGTNWQIIAS